MIQLRNYDTNSINTSPYTLLVTGGAAVSMKCTAFQYFLGLMLAVNNREYEMKMDIYPVIPDDATAEETMRIMATEISIDKNMKTFSMDYSKMMSDKLIQMEFEFQDGSSHRFDDVPIDAFEVGDFGTDRGKKWSKYYLKYDNKTIRFEVKCIG